MTSSNHYDFCCHFNKPDKIYKMYYCNFYRCYRCDVCHCPAKEKQTDEKGKVVLRKNERNRTQLIWYKRNFKPCNLLYDYIELHVDDHCLADIMKMTITKNVMKNIVNIKQSDFVNGPYIIKRPGYYRLCEDIIFSPNKHSDGKPTKEWLNNLDEKYRSAYSLGFFAMIVIQSDNVIFDLNYHTIEQSELFFHQQTFYSHIELASTPFIMGQGPANFGDNEKVASNVIIKNGCLGLSSHHGIHAPGYSKNIIIDNLSIEKFAVAGVHLNGAHNVYINNVHLNNENLEIKFNSLFSQSQFILPFLEKIDPNQRMFLGNELILVKDIINDLKHEIKLVYNSLNSNNIEYPLTGIFANTTKLLDANMYGIVLNSKGIAVNGLKNFKEKVPADEFIGNNNIVLKNVSVKNITSSGTEIKGLENKNASNEENSYGKGTFTGPVGDIFDFQRVVNEDGFYVGNVYSNAQIAVAKFLDTRSTIPKEIIDWASGIHYTKFNHMIDENNYYIVDGRDSMSHIMKGNIGIFCSQAYRMIGQDILIKNVKNFSDSSTEAPCESDGVLFTGCKNIMCKNYSILNIYSKNGTSADLMYKNQNINIQT